MVKLINRKKGQGQLDKKGLDLTGRDKVQSEFESIFKRHTQFKEFSTMFLGSPFSWDIFFWFHHVGNELILRVSEHTQKNG